MLHVCKKPIKMVKQTLTAKADSGASKHYIPYDSRNILQHRKIPTNPPPVHLADDTEMFAKETGNLPLSPALASEATETQAFSELKTPLLSMGQLCDDNCTVTLKKETLQVEKNNKIILRGT